MQAKDTILVNDSDDKIADDDSNVRKVTTSEVLDSPTFAEISGDKQMNVMLNELMEKVKTLKLKTSDKVLPHVF